jgi:uncharacterized repeat protein (TIGR01451 family)
MPYPLQKIVSIILIFAIGFSQIGAVPSVYASSSSTSSSVAHASSPVTPATPPNRNEVVHDLVVLVVEKELQRNNSSFVGLINAYDGSFARSLNKTLMRDRILRYAEDITDNNLLTDVKIIVFDRAQDDVLSLANALENFYKNGDGNRNNKLRGVVLIGEIPLPVVNKNGNRFISIFPYTNFDNKAYLYNPQTNSFERNTSVTFPKQDIWHGIIRPPADDSAGIQKLAEFFDKNHLHYLGEPLFADFDRKLFFGDLVEAEKAKNSDLYKKYLMYLDYMEDLAYFRFNKKWANDLTGDVMAALADEIEELTGDPLFNMDNELNKEQFDNRENRIPGFAEQMKSEDLMSGVPDLMNRSIIEKNLMQYGEVFGGYISNLNDLADYTARYTPTDVHSTPLLINIKDLYTKHYLRHVNDALENKINEIVSEIEEPLPLLRYTQLSGEFRARDSDGRIISTAPFAFLPRGNDFPAEDVYYHFNYVPDRSTNGEMFINGISGDVIESIKQCAPYLGSVGTGEQGQYSTLTRSVSFDNQHTSKPIPTSGVNTRILSPEELFAKIGSSGNISPEGSLHSGALIESNPSYGISSFLPNTLYPNNPGPFERELAEDDVILKVNGIPLGPNYTFDQAIQDSFDVVKAVIEISKDKNLSRSEKVAILNSPPFDLVVNPGHTLGTQITRAVGYISVEYWRGGRSYKKYFSFSVRFQPQNRNKEFTLEKDTPVNSLQVFVLLDRPPLTSIIPALTPFQRLLAFYSENQNKGAVFNLYQEGDISEGCNFKETRDDNGNLRDDDGKLLLENCDPLTARIPILDPVGSVDIFSVEEGDSNPFPVSNLISSPEKIDNLYLDACYLGRNTNSTTPPNKSDVNNLINNPVDAGDIILNSSPRVTLKDFTDRYGLFDGIDNTENGNVDYRWIDNLSTDPPFQIKRYYLDEANSDFGLPSSDMNQIARKMLTHDTEYVVPYSNAEFRNLDGNTFTRDLVLNVTPHFYKGRTISSMVIHNEPTLHTLSEQCGSLFHPFYVQACQALTDSLPIDNPRYVFFQSKPEPFSSFVPQNPFNPQDTISSYYPGKEHRIEYINLFSDDLSTFDNLKIAIDLKALELAKIPGSYRIFDRNASEGDYTTLQIMERLRNDLLGVVQAPNDNYSNALYPELFAGKELKIYDAMTWKNLTIDEKHIYVLKNYLNREKDPYVSKVDGYEIAYLVFDGQQNYFDVSFNKGLPEELDPNFDPIQIAMAEFDAEEEIVEQAKASVASGSTGVDSSFQFVMLWDFLKELILFVEGFSAIGSSFQEACDFRSPHDDSDKDLDALAGPPFSGLEIETPQPTTTSLAGEPFLVTVRGLDSDGNVLFNNFDNRSVKLTIDQFGQDSIFEFTGPDERPLVNGFATFNLIKTGEQGEAVFYATSSNLPTDSLDVLVTGRELKMASYVYHQIDGMDDLVSAIEEAERIDTPEVLQEDPPQKHDDIDYNEYGELLGNFLSRIRGGVEEEKLQRDAADQEDVSSLDPDAPETDEGDSAEVVAPGYERDLREIIDIISPIDPPSTLPPSVVPFEEGPSPEEDPIPPVDEEIKEEDPAPIDEDDEESLDFTPVPEDEDADEDEYLDMTWEEYFIRTQYYQRFLDFTSRPASNSIDSGRRLLASLMPVGVSSFNLVNPENPFLDAINNPESPFVVIPSKNFVADGESLMKVDVKIFNNDGLLETNLNRNVRFSVEDISVGIPTNQIVTFRGGNVVRLNDGTATVYLQAGTKTGVFNLKAEVLARDGTNVDRSYPPVINELYLEAGPPVFVDIKPDSSVLVANEISSTKVDVFLKDKFGNVAENDFSMISVFIDNPLKINENLDANKRILGTQIPTMEGKASFDVFAKNITGEAKLVALLTDMELEELLMKEDIRNIDFREHTGSTKSFQILDRVVLEGVVLDRSFQEIDSIPADGNSIARIGVKLLHGNNVVDKYNGPVRFSVLDQTLGNFTSEPPQKMSFGTLNPANVSFRSGIVAGDVDVLVDIPGFVSDTINFKTTHGVPAKISLTASSDSINTNSRNSVTLSANIFDQNGNPITNDSGVTINFKTSDATRNLVSFESQRIVTSEGEAKTRLSAGSASGKVNIIAEAQGMPTATISLDVAKRVTSQEVAEFAPRALYVSLLGGPFGNIKDRNNLAQTLLFSGQVQALSAVTATPQDSQRLFGVDSHGQLQIFDGTIEPSVLRATDSFPYQRIIFSNPLFEQPLAELFLVPKNNTPLVLIEDRSEIPSRDGIYVNNLIPDDQTLQFEKTGNAIYVKTGEEVKFYVDRFGRISINDDRFSISLPYADDLVTGDFVLTVERNTVPVASIVFKQNFGKNIVALPHDNQRTSFPAGLYVKLRSASEKYDVVPAFSGISTDEPMGVYFVDTEETISSVQAPGFSYDSLENGGKKFGVGFDADNKHMLLFAGGNSVGESHLPYPSETGLVFGDPLIKLQIDEDLISRNTGYSKDLGIPIFTDSEDIEHIVTMDFNGNGYEDILVGREDGLIRLLENVVSNQRFIDRGYVLHVSGGITSMQRIDVNNDGYDDLLVGTEEACKVGEDCVSLFINNNGHFVRESLNLSLGENKIRKMMVADMDGDGCEDLVLSDSSARVSIHYNINLDGRCTGLASDRGNSWSFAPSVNSTANLAENIFVNYPGMESLGKDNAHKFVQFSLQSRTPEKEMESAASDAMDFALSIANNPNIATASIPPTTFPKSFDFIHLPQDNRFIGSEKKTKDLNGGTLQVGDEIEYHITLKNPGSASINNLILSDSTPVSLTLNLDSLKCLDLNCPDNLQWEDTGMAARSHVIKNISVPAGGERNIRYTMTVDVVSGVDFDIGKDFVNYPTANQTSALDIEIKRDFNPDGILTYLYATAPRTYRKYDLDTTKLESPTSSEEEALEELKELGKVDLSGIESENDVPWEMKNFLSGAASSKNSFVYAAGLANNVANAVENTLSALRCSGGGCLPVPSNKALFAPDGPVPPIPGLTVFSLVSYIPFFIPFMPSGTDSFFRFYVSPTLTLGLGTAACAGPGIGHAAPCFAFAIPGGIPGLCDALNSALGLAKTGSKGSTTNSAGMATIISDGEGTTSGISDIDLGGNWSDPSDPISAGAKVNVKIPGFPSVVTNWMDKQTDEIYDKLLDLPTFYFILPDFSPWSESMKQFDAGINAMRDPNNPNSVWQNINDFASTVAKLPFVQIEGREVVMKVPSISMQQLEIHKMQWQRLLDSLEQQLNDRIAIWNCGENEATQTICDKLIVDIHNLSSSIMKLMEFMDQLGNLPRDILQWRSAQAKYATQIICYMDSIMQFIGGYMKRQQKIADSWLKAVQDVLRAFKSWQVILNVFFDYQQSCDRCRSDRTSKLGLLLNVFLAVPEPPVIPFPKWPDIVMDLSQIRTGVRIIWPDIVFKPEPIVLPSPPNIILPEIIPTVFIDLNLPSFDFSATLPNFEGLMLPLLPDLPPLPLPDLPDLPRPPRIPQLPSRVASLAKNFKAIFKILCLLKEGKLFVPEATLATKIETLTQPSVHALLPILKNLGVQMPGIQYSYVKEIRITAELNLHLDTNFIYNSVKSGAKIWNDSLKKNMGVLNRTLKIPFNIIQNLFDALNEKSQSLMEEVASGIERSIQRTTDPIQRELESYEPSTPSSYENYDFIQEDILKNFAEINAEIEEYIASLEYEYVPETYYLTATETILEPDHPALNRSLSEIKSDIRKEDFSDIPELQNMVAVRNSLISYVDGVHDSNKTLQQINNLEDFATILAQSNQDGKKISSLLASDSVVDSPATSTSTTTVATSLLGGSIEKTIKDSASQISESRKVATTIDSTFMSESLQESASKSSPPIPIGLYILSQDGTTNENVISYSPSLKKKNHILYGDFDNDRDEDMIFVSGNEIYLKTNHKNSPTFSKGTVTNVVGSRTVSNYINLGGTSVQNFKVDTLSHNKIDLSWSPNPDAVYYEILIRNSAMHNLNNYAQKFMIATENFDEDEDVIPINNPANPRATLHLENGYYVGSIRSINRVGNKSLNSVNIAVSPQICADKEPPFPAVSADSFEIPIFKELVIDASNSFDADGEVVEYYLETLPYSNGDLVTTRLPRYLWSDINVLVDTSGDGIPWNDRSNPVFRIGPFVHEGDIGKREMILHVADQSGNKSSMKIEINVIVPDITLDETFARTSVATGKVDPLTENIPFSLMRMRYIYRVVEDELVLIQNLLKLRDSFTDRAGFYRIDDFENEDMVIVENSLGDAIAEIHPKSGNIKILVEGYSTIVRPARIPDSPTKVDVVDSNNFVLGSVYLVTNSNSDVRINEISPSGVSVFVLGEENRFDLIARPASDPKHPGGVILVDKQVNSVLAVFDTGGNIILTNQNVYLRQKANDHKSDPLVVEILYNNAVVAEHIVAPRTADALIVGPKDVPFFSPRNPTFATMNPFGRSIEALFKDGASTDIRKIIDELYKADSDFGFSSEDFVQRDEFVRVLLIMLCIEPRPEAYEVTTSMEFYIDALDLGIHFAFINEATIRGLIHGYKGEIDERGLTPFKSDNTITRAEATKIIVEALEMEGILDLTDFYELEFSGSGPWYNPFMKVGQDLTPYITAEYFSKNNFVITPEEALTPNEKMTFGELLIMVKRVLDIYNCLEGEDDDLRPFLDVADCEENPAVACKLGAPGVYLVPANCNTCPCVSSFNFKPDVMPGDLFFPIISVEYEDRHHIFSRGNQVLVPSN